MSVNRYHCNTVEGGFVIVDGYRSDTVIENFKVADDAVARCRELNYKWFQHSSFEVAEMQGAVMDVVDTFSVVMEDETLANALDIAVKMLQGIIERYEDRKTANA